MWRAVAVVGLAVCASASASEFDQDLAWPLCGRITESPPAGWDGTSCPPERWGDPAHADYPLSDTFGPRVIQNQGGRYDFHRGIDMPTPAGTPVFAVSDGKVMIAGHHSAYADPLVQVRHQRPGASTCRHQGCWYSLYMHLSGWAVARGDRVSKGQLLGYSGASATGYEHLHFEVRDSPPTDPYSRWLRDAIHPLDLLAYPPAAPAVTILSPVDPLDAEPEVVVYVSAPAADVASVEVRLEEADGTPVPQYPIDGPLWDVDRWNFDYTHKDSSAVPWESFQAGGENACPHADAHGAAYDPAVHLDLSDFNGVEVTPEDYHAQSAAAEATWRFHALVGPAWCVEAVVTTADGATSTARRCAPAP